MDRNGVCLKHSQSFAICTGGYRMASTKIAVSRLESAGKDKPSLTRLNRCADALSYAPIIRLLQDE